MINILFPLFLFPVARGVAAAGHSTPSTNRQRLPAGLCPPVPTAGKPGWIEAGEQGEKAVLGQVVRVIEQSDLRVQSFIEMSKSGGIIWG